MWFPRWPRTVPSAQRKHRPAAYRPQLEMLEDRLTPAAVFPVLQTLAPPLTAPSGLSGLASGDFNGDGRIDLLTISSTSDQLCLFPGLGNGTFGTPVLTQLAAGTGPVGLAAGKFNGDNIQDVAVASSSGTILIFLGAASGVFQPATAITTAGPVSALTTGLDQNGLSDVVAVNPVAATLTVYLNKGNNTFTTATPASVTTAPSSVAIGDFNGDGALDAIVGSATNNTITLLASNGSGTFTPTNLTLPAGATAANLLLVGSGQLSQLAVSDTAGSQFFLFTSNGAGGFTLAQTVTGITNPTQITAGDFNGDGTPDFAVGNGAGNSVTLLPGNRGGSPPLSPPVTLFNTGPSANFLASADFNDDGKIDLASGNSAGAAPSITVAQNQSTPVGYFATSSDRGSQPVVNIYSAQGQLLFSFNPLLGASFTGGLRVAVGNVVGDATPDLVIGTGAGGVTLIMVFDGASILAGNPKLVAAFNPYGNAFAGGVFVAVGNLNGSSFDQIITGADSGGGAEVSIFSLTPNLTGTGAPFTALTDGAPLFVYPLGSFFGGIRVAAADINGDGLDDIVTGAGPGGGPEVAIFLGSKSGFYNPNPFASFFGITPNTFTGGIFVAAGDFNGDFKAEVVVSADRGGGPQVQVFNGATITATPSGTPSVGGFNALSPPTFTGGTRVATTIGQFRPAIGRVLVSTAGPGGNQLTIFDVASFLINPMVAPPQFLGVFTPPLGLGIGQFAS